MTSRHDMPFGAQLLESGGAAFRLWAPSAERIELELNASRHAMHKLPQGWHEAHRPDATPGARYRFLLPNGLAVPDPASRLNPDDVHGASELVDPLAYTWKDETWRGRPWHEAVIYEMHVGTFTPEGTFTAAARRLEGLAQLGITAIELMPLADFPGQRGWGYDGVLPFAPDTAYGSPGELKALIDHAHAHGLMVLLDVVYNHFGPEGNYLHAYCPEFFNAAHQTPWGAAINFDGEHSGPVREFFVHNALYWVEEFHIDGLRLDAVHAIHDDSPEHIVTTIARALREGPGQHRQVHMVLENERNQAHRLERGTAQWNDDFHHAAHVLLTGETDAHYDDFSQAPGDMLGRALAEGFAYQGQASRFREGRPHGEPSAHLPSTAFISFVQNHDQIGNRAFGERLHQLTDARWLEAMYACLLLSPHVPMLFAGEEWAASTPFLYFCDFGPELAAAVSAGRRAEFGRFAAFSDPNERERIPDPNARSTFTASQLNWDEREQSPHRERLELVRTLLALRREHLVPRLAGHPGAGRYRFEAGLLRVEWQLGEGSIWHLMAHFGAHASDTPPAPSGEVLYTRGVSAHAAGALQLAPGAVRVTRVPGHG